MGGKPFPDGWEPDDDRGGADEDFASVVFDEDFIRAAPVHEPTAVERLLAAAEARADAEAARARALPGGPDDDRYDDGRGPGSTATGGRTAPRTTRTTRTAGSAPTDPTAAPCAPTGAAPAGTGPSPGSSPW